MQKIAHDGGAWQDEVNPLLIKLNQYLNGEFMYALAILRYRRPLDEVLTVLEEHRSYLGGLKEQGVLLASGPLDPRSGGALLLRVPDEAAHESLDRVRDGDPFTRTGMAQYELMPWGPTIGKDGLDRL